MHVHFLRHKNYLLSVKRAQINHEKSIQFPSRALFCVLHLVSLYKLLYIGFHKRVCISDPSQMSESPSVYLFVQFTSFQMA